MHRIAIIGGGAIGATHAAALASSVRADLVALVDPAQTGPELAGEWGCGHLSDLDALDPATIDGAIVATPNHLHAPQAIHLMERGVPVLVEKPLGASPEAAQSIAEASRRLDLPGLVGHHRRHNPILRAAHSFVQGGEFGALVAGTVLSTLAKPPSYFDVPWRSEPGAGGTLLINLIHEIDLVRHLFGEISEVSAVAGHHRRGLAVEDTAAVILSLTQGGIVTVTLSDAAVGPWSWDITAGENPARFPAMDAASHMFAGSRAGLSLPDLRTWRHDGDVDWTVPQAMRRLHHGSADIYLAQLEHFLDVIENRAAPLCTFEDGARNVAMVAAVARSSELRRPVAIDLPAPAQALRPGNGTE